MEIQCHAATSFCWCVTKEGRPISGTSLQGKKPSCKGTELNIWRFYVWLKDFRFKKKIPFKLVDYYYKNDWDIGNS